MMPKSKNNWKITLKDILIPVLSTIVALAGIASGVVMQRASIQSQIEMKKLEVVLPSNQKNYAEFMKYLWQAYNDAMEHKGDDMYQDLRQLQYNYDLMEPFFPDEDSRIAMKTLLDKFHGWCWNLYLNIDPSTGENITKSEIEILNDYDLYEQLFRDGWCVILFSTKPLPK